MFIVTIKSMKQASLFLLSVLNSINSLPYWKCNLELLLTLETSSAYINMHTIGYCIKSALLYI